MINQLNLTICGATTISVMASYCAAQPVRFLSDVHVGAISVLRIEIPRGLDGGKVHVAARCGDESFQGVPLVEFGNGTIPVSRFDRLSDGTGVLVIPSVGLASQLSSSAVFQAPGDYVVRVTCGNDSDKLPPSGPDAPDVGANVRPPLESDLALVAQINGDAKDALIRNLGLSRIEQRAAQSLGAAYLLNQIVTRIFQDPERGVPEAAETLFQIASTYAQSSYASYLAYYAACGYLHDVEAVTLKLKHGITVPDKRVRDVANYMKGIKALEFAVQHGDAFVRPLALIRLAGHKGMADDIAAGKELLRQVEETYSDRPRVLRVVSAMREALAELERRR